MQEQAIVLLQFKYKSKPLSYCHLLQEEAVVPLWFTIFKIFFGGGPVGGIMAPYSFWLLLNGADYGNAFLNFT